MEEFTTKTKMLMHYSRLSEKDRRQYAALESLKLGRGGTTYISLVLEVDRGTIIQGRKELTSTLADSAPRKSSARLAEAEKKPQEILT